MADGNDDLGLLPGKQLIPLLWGWNAADLWDCLNLVFISYALMALAPRWKHTATLTLVAPCLHSAVYISSMVSLFRNDSGEEVADMFTLQGVVTLFKDPNTVFVGWVHYVVFDCLVARMICLDSIQRGASLPIHILFVVPCLLFTLMAGPFGFLSYMILRQVILPNQQPTMEFGEPKIKFI